MCTVREIAGADHMGIAVLPPFVAQVAEAVDALVAQVGFAAAAAR